MEADNVATKSIGSKVMNKRAPQTWAFSTSLCTVLLYIRIYLTVDFPRGTQLVTSNVLTRIVEGHYEQLKKIINNNNNNNNNDNNQNTN